jgi:hypothetical protein
MNRRAWSAFALRLTFFWRTWLGLFARFGALYICWIILSISLYHGNLLLCRLKLLQLGLHLVHLIEHQNLLLKIWDLFCHLIYLKIAGHSFFSLNSHLRSHHSKLRRHEHGLHCSHRIQSHLGKWVESLELLLLEWIGLLLLEHLLLLSLIQWSRSHSWICLLKSSLGVLVSPRLWLLSLFFVSTFLI